MLKLSQNAISMLSAKYRVVLLKMFLKNSAVLAASGLIFCAPATDAANYDVGTGKTYKTLEDLRAAAAGNPKFFQKGDTVTIYTADSGSLNNSLDFQNKTIAVQPKSSNIRFFNLIGETAALAGDSGVTVTGFNVEEYGSVLYLSDNSSFATGNTTFSGNKATTGDYTIANNISTDPAGAAIFDVEPQNAKAKIAGNITRPEGLVKTGEGELALANTLNDYSGKTIIESGTLNITAKNDGTLSMDEVRNNSWLKFSGNNPASSKNITINTYSGNGTVELQAEINAQKQWSDLLTFTTTTTTAGGVKIHFYFLPIPDMTYIAAGYERNSIKRNTGSHAGINGNNMGIDMGWRTGKKTTTGNYDAECDGGIRTINANGKIKTHAVGLFADYRPNGGATGQYYRAMFNAGDSSNGFRANNAIGGSGFKSDKSLIGASLGGGYVKPIGKDRSAEYYSHFIHTRLGSDELKDSIGQIIKFDVAECIRLMSGMRHNFNQSQKTSAYIGAAIDYEFSGKPDGYIDGNKAAASDLHGLSGVIELGGVSKQSKSSTIDLGRQVWAVKKQGMEGMALLSRKF